MIKIRNIKRLLKDMGRPVNIVVVPHNGLPSFKFSFSFLFLVAACMMWTGITIWSGYAVGRHFDYYVTKMDNKMLKNRIEHISSKIAKGLVYLEMAQKTDEQLRKIIGMAGGENAVAAIGGAASADLMNFKKAVSFKYAESGQNPAYGGDSHPPLDNSILKMEDESKKRLSSFREITWYIANKYNFSKALPSVWPAQGRLTSSFGYRIAPMIMASEFHSGIDIANEPGAPILSSADGVVRYSGWSSGYGIAVLVDHGFGYSTLYAHLSQPLVKEGDKVKRGQIIGRMGSTGTSTGTHLHYEVWDNGVPKNPIKFIKAGVPGADFSSLFNSLFQNKSL
ncbi:MAG: M23 family metallopeptidase [Elusimicrobia bacterium]|nr:M23 family metallopeptidase [Elusimicrobiota bacterium]